MLDRSHETSMLKGRVNKARDDDDCAVLLMQPNKTSHDGPHYQEWPLSGLLSSSAVHNVTQLKSSAWVIDRLLAFRVVYMLYTYSAKGTQDLQNLMANTDRRGDAAPDYKEQQVNLFLEAHKSELKTYKRHYL